MGSRTSKKLSDLLALILILMGLIVMGGWIAKSTILVQIYPTLVPMQFNTALCFMLSGLSIFLLSQNERYARFFSGIVFSIGFLTLIQYLLEINIGLDELFIDHYTKVETSHIGRMAPSTAIAFSLTGIATWLGVFISSGYIKEFRLALICIIFSLGLLSLLGYIMEIPTAYGWGTLTRMALHTSIGFLLIGLSLGIRSLQSYKNEEVSASLQMPIIVFFISSSFFIFIWMTSTHHNEEVFHDDARKRAEFISKEIESIFYENKKAIVRFFERSASDSMPLKDKIKDAKNYLRDMEGLAFIKIHDKKDMFLLSDIITSESSGELYKKCSSDWKKNIKNEKFLRVSIQALGEENYICFISEKNHEAMAIEIDAFLNATSIARANHVGFDSIGIWDKNQNIVWSLSSGDRDKRYQKEKYQEVVKISFEPLNLKVFFNPSKNFIREESESFNDLLVPGGILFSLILSLSLHFLRVSFVKNQALKVSIKKVEDSENRFKKVLDNSPASIVIIDKNGKVVLCTEQSEKLFGMNEDNCCGGDQFGKMISGRCREKILEALNSDDDFLLEKITEEGPDIFVTNTQGEKIAVTLSAIPIEMDGVRNALCMFMDVREKEIQQRKLVEQEKNIRLIYEVTRAATEAKTLEDSFQRVVDLICQMVKWPVGHVYFFDDKKEELISSKIWFAYDRGKAEDFISVTEEKSFKKGEGLPGRIWDSLKPLWIKDVFQDDNFPRAKLCSDIGVHGAFGFPVLLNEKIVAVLEFFSFEEQEQDDRLLEVIGIISDQLGRIFERKEAYDALVVSEEKNRLLLDQAGEGIYGLDKEGRGTFINQAASRMLGYAADEMVGELVHPKIHHTFPDGRIYPVEACPMYAALKDGQRHTIFNELLWRKDGSSFWVDYSSTPVFNDGQIVGAVVVFRDISERKENELLLENQRMALEESNRELDEFAYIVSHDLKEPLRGIHNYSEFLMEDYSEKLGEEGKKKLTTLKTLSKRMDDIISNLLEYSRLNRVEMSFQECDLNKIVSERVEMIKEYLKENNAVVNLQKELPAIFADGVRIGELFHNLIINGIKYNESSKKIIEISYEESENEYKFCIKDNGIGIEEKHREKVFDMFQRLHTRDKFGGGTGAGLTMSKRIVEKHKGKIWIASKEGEGSEVFFTIPKVSKWV